MKIKFMLLLIAALVWLSDISHAQVNVRDSLALVDLYNSTDGQNWSKHYGWLHKPVQNWYGITVSGNRVIKINLTFNRLAGSIPFSLSNLDSLQRLNLSVNELDDSIPSSLGNLKSLQVLNLGQNSLHGNIPSSLGNLTNLQTLNLWYNQLSGSIPSSLGNLVNLKELLLDDNQLSGSVPSSFGNLSKLTRLTLQFNQLSGNIPSSLGNLLQLQYLYLFINQLSGSIPSSLGKLSKLKYLDLSTNHLSGTIPSSLDSLPAIKTFIIADNKFTFNGMEGLAEAYQTGVYLEYGSQDSIPVIQNGGTLSVKAGGTLSNNTYYWYKNDSLVKTKTGSEKFTPKEPGDYYVAVTNAIATDLTLVSDVITISSFTGNKNFSTAENNFNELNLKTFVYPNPAKDIATLVFNASGKYSITVTDISGKILNTYSGIALKAENKIQLDISNYMQGMYLITIADAQNKKRVIKLTKE